MKDNVDKRVVEFEFDNSNFDKNVKKSTKTLQEFEETLEFKDVSNSLDQIKMKFSTFDVMVASTVKNITDRVVNLGIRLVKSLSIDNISDGWTKFGQKTIAVGTLMSQSLTVAGNAIEDYSEKMDIVNEQLEKLNWFTDQTSYNFTDMVDNIGKFTAAGQDLDTSVEAMMGIANWAAMSGQNATTASRAMYQLSQALGKGYVQLIDWKSIQNANMDTQEFRKVVLETAVSVGELTQEGEQFITKTGKKFTQNQFTEQLASKWFTSDVLTKSLQKYSAAVDDLYKISEETGWTASKVIEEYGDQFDEFAIKAFKAAQEARTFTDVINATKDAVSTGWMKAAEYVFGGYDEAKVFWTDLADEMWEVFAAGVTFRNEILKVWSALEGRVDLFQKGGDKQGAFWNIYDSIIAVRDIIKSAWNTIFPSTEFEDEADQANELGHSFKTFTENLQKATAKMKAFLKENQTLTKIFQGVFSILRFVVSIIETLRYALDPLIYSLKQVATVLLDFVANMADKLTSSTQYIEKFYNAAEKLNMVLTNIFSVLNVSGAINKITSAATALYNVVSRIVKSVSNFFKENVQLGNFLVTTSEGMVQLSGSIKNVFASLKEGITFAKDFSIFGLITGNQNKKSNDEQQGKDAVESVSATNDIFVTLKEFLGSILNLLSTIYPLAMSVVKLATTIINTVADFVKQVTSWIVALAQKETDMVQDLKKLLVIAGALLVLYELVKIFLNLKWMATYLKVNVFAFLDTAADALNKWGIAQIIESIGHVLRNIAIAMILLFAAFKLFSTMTWDDIWPGLIVLGAMAVFMITLAVVAKKLTNTTTLAAKTFTNSRTHTTISELTSFLIAFGVGFMLIAKALVMIGEIPEENMDDAISVMAVFGVFCVVMAIVGKQMDGTTASLRKALPSSLQLLSFVLVLKTVMTGISKVIDVMSNSGKSMLEMAEIIGIIVLALIIIIYYMRKGAGTLGGRGGIGTIAEFNAGIMGTLIGIAAVLAAIALLCYTISALGASATSAIALVAGILVVLFAGCLVLYTAIIVGTLILKKKEIEVDAVLKLNPVAGCLLAIGASLLSISASLWILSKIELNWTMIKLLGIITLFIVIVFGAVLLMMKSYKDSSSRLTESVKNGKRTTKSEKSAVSTSNAIAGIVKSIAILLLAVTVSIAVLAGLSWAFGTDTVVKIFVAITAFILVVMAMIIGVIKAMAKLENAVKGQSKTLKKKIALVISVLLVIAGLIAGLIIVQQFGLISWQSGVAITVLLVALYGIVEIIEKLAKIDITEAQAKGKIALLNQILKALIVLSLCMLVLRNIDPINGAINMGVMLVALYAMTGVIKIIAKLNTDIKQVAKFAVGVAILAVAMITIAGALAVFSLGIKALQQNVKVDWALFGYIMAFIGAFFVLGAVMAYLPIIAAGMVLLAGVITVTIISFSAAMYVLAWGLKALIPQIDRLKSESIINLRNLLLWMSLTGLIGIYGIIGNSSLGVGMFVLGWGLSNLIGPMNQLTAEGVYNLKTLLLWLSLTGVSGILGIVGNSSLGTGMYVLGWGLGNLAGPMSELTSEGVKNLYQLLLWLSLTGVSGILGIAGNSSLGTGMEVLGWGLSNLAPQMALLTEEGVRNLKNLLLWMSLTGLTGVLGAVGNSSLGVGMTALGAGLAVLNLNLSNLDESRINGLKKLLEVLSGGGNGENFWQKIGNGFLALFSAGTNASLSVAMLELGGALAVLNPALSNITTDSINGLKTLIEFVRDSNNFKINNSESKNITSSIAGNLTAVFNSLATAIKNFMSTVSVYNTTQTLTFLDYILKLIDFASTGSEFVIKPILDLSNIREGYAEISSLMTSINGSAGSLSSNLAYSNASNEASKYSGSSSGATTTTNVTETYNVTFNVTSDDPEALADALDVELQKRHTNYKLSKGGGGR